MDKAGTTEGMKGGGFYDAHSEFQRRIVADGLAAIDAMVNAIDVAAVTNSGSGACTIADYGCGTGGDLRAGSGRGGAAVAATGWGVAGPCDPC